MTERERILEKLEKIKARADRGGTEGERAAAEELLASLMARYGITEEDLEDSAVKTYDIRYKTEYERRLIRQLAYKHTGSGHAFGCVGKYTGRQRKKVLIECTAAQYIEIKADFDFYSEAMAEEMDLFYRAFIDKNQLYPPPELIDEGIDSKLDMATALKIAQMASGIDRRTRNKALEAASHAAD